MMGSILFFIAFILVDTAKAENSTFVLAYNQARYEHTCLDVSHKDLKQAGYDCDPRAQLHSSAIQLWDVFNWNIFQQSAENQVNKDKCLIEQLSSIYNDDNLKTIWYSQIAAAWMGARKSELILAKCKFETFRRTSADNIAAYGLKKAYEIAESSSDFRVKTLPPLEKEWKDLCTNSEALGALAQGKALFQFSIPVLSDPAFSKFMDENREMIQNAKTGAPLSDDDLLKADLQDLSFVKLKVSPKFEQQMKKAVDHITDQRKSMVTKFENSRSDNHYNLTTDLKDYIYEDGTLSQTLISKDLLDPNYSGLTHNDVTNMGAFCVLAKYEPSFVGSFAEFIVTSAIAGGLSSKLFKGVKYLQQISKEKSAFQLGFQAANYGQLARQVQMACDPKVQNSVKKIASASDSELLVRFTASDLPAKIGFKIWDTPMDPAKTPSCQKIEDKNLILKSDFQLNCTMNALLTLAPLKYSLPALGVAVMAQ